MNFSQAEIRAMVFALTTVRDSWFEQPHQEMEFSYDEVESALAKVSAYTGSISPPDDPWWDLTRPPDKP